MGFNKLMGFEIWSHIKSVSHYGEESVNIWCGQTIIKYVHLFNLMFKKKNFPIIPLWKTTSLSHAKPHHS